MVLKTRSWSLLTILSSSSPKAAMAQVVMNCLLLLAETAVCQTPKQRQHWNVAKLQSICDGADVSVKGRWRIDEGA